jgi:WD40 repeat protein
MKNMQRFLLIVLLFGNLKSEGLKDAASVSRVPSLQSIVLSKLPAMYAAQELEPQLAVELPVELQKGLRGECLAQLLREHALVGHAGAIVSAVYSPDGKLVVTASSDKTARLWCAATGNCLFVLRGHMHRINSVDFSPDCKLVVTSSSDRTVRIWDAATGKCIHVLRGHPCSVVLAGFSSDGRFVDATLENGKACIWKVETWKCLGILKRQSNFADSRESKDDFYFVMPEDGTLCIHSTTTKKCVRVLTGHEQGVFSAEFSPNKELVVSASHDGTTRLWNVATGECLHTVLGHDNPVRFADFSPDGMSIMAASAHGVYIWNISSALLELVGVLDLASKKRESQSLENLEGSLGKALESEIDK